MYSVVKYVVFVTCVLFKFIFGDSLCTQCKDYRLPEFDGKGVTDFQLATFLHVEIAGFCSRRCSEDHRCRSYRYNTKTKTCSTYGGGFFIPTSTLNSVTEEDGSRLYAFCGRPSLGMKCKTSSHCAFQNSACTNGTCGCVTGTSYDVTTGDCLIRCNTYGSEFGAHEDFGVDQCNTNTLTTSTMEACIAACKAESGFLCVNAEFGHKDGTCNLCNTPVLELPDKFSAYPGWTLVVRHCAH